MDVAENTEDALHRKPHSAAKWARQGCIKLRKAAAGLIEVPTLERDPVGENETK